jgi:hypothetical protein
MFFSMNVQAQLTKFYIPAGADYDVQLKEFEHNNEHIKIKIEASPEVWMTIDLVMLFNLRWDNRNQGSVSGENPVEIVLFLSKDIYQKLSDSGNLLTDVNAFLQASKDHPMKSTVNWCATEVTEEVSLPEYLKDKGSLREGFTTTWKEVFE